MAARASIPFKTTGVRYQTLELMEALFQPITTSVFPRWFMNDNRAGR